jgi:hypothetical protein
MEFEYVKNYAELRIVLKLIYKKRLVIMWIILNWSRIMYYGGILFYPQLLTTEFLKTLRGFSFLYLRSIPLHRIVYSA